MKKIIILACVWASFQACNSLKDPAENPVRGKSYLKIIHANPNAPMLDIYSRYYNQTNKIGSELMPSKSLPDVGYMELQSSDEPSASGTGTYWIHAQAAQTLDTIYKPVSILLSKDTYHSLFCIDSAGTHKFLFFKDPIQKPDSGFALVRFFNAKFGNNNLKLISGASQTSTVNFMEISGYVLIPAGTHSFSVLDANGNTLHSLQNITLKNQSAYTFFEADNLYYTQQSQ